VLLAREEGVLQGINERLTEIGRYHEMETNVEKTKVMIISRQSSPILSLIDQKQPETVQYFSYLGSMAKLTQDLKGILNPVLPWQTQRQEYHFHQQTGLKFEEETSKLLHLE